MARSPHSWPHAWGQPARAQRLWAAREGRLECPRHWLRPRPPAGLPQPRTGCALPAVELSCGHPSAQLLSLSPEAAAFPDQGSGGLLSALSYPPHVARHHTRTSTLVCSPCMARSCHRGSGRGPHVDLGRSGKAAFRDPQTEVNYEIGPCVRQRPRVAHSVMRVSLGESEA